MKLIIEEYLSLLKEEGELDVLLTTLLKAMGFKIVYRPQKGVTQNGVDLCAVGEDFFDQNESEENGRRKLFIFVLKQKDISRSNWNTSHPQSVRPTLDSIFDSYIPRLIENEYRGLPIKVVLCFNGVMEQALTADWSGYTNRNSSDNIKIVAWNIDTLTDLIYKHLLNESVFENTSKRLLRKTLSFLDIPGYEPIDYYQLVEDILTKIDFSSQQKRNDSLKKIFRSINLSLNILKHWCEDVDNLKPSILAAERTLLITWKWIIENNLKRSTVARKCFKDIFITAQKIFIKYLNKFEELFEIRHGLFAHRQNDIEYSLIAFEQLGILGEIGLNLLVSIQDKETREIWEPINESVAKTQKAIWELVYNNEIMNYPRLDSHSTEISLALAFFIATNINDPTSKSIHLWLDGISSACRYTGIKPFSTDSYNSLFESKFKRKEIKEPDFSILIPTLFSWILCSDHAIYERFRDLFVKLFKKTDMELWLPDENSFFEMCKTNAAYKTGHCITSIEFPENIEAFRQELTQNLAHIVAIWQEPIQSCKLKSLDLEFLISVISSRHFRTPFPPNIIFELAKIF